MLNKPVQIGDILCRVLRYPAKGEKEYYEVKVVRVGRRYIYIQREGSYKERRYTQKGLADDDYSRSHGVRSELYHSEEEYLDIKRKRQIWSRLKTEMYNAKYSPPSHLTTEEIEEIYRKIFPDRPEG